MTASRRELAVAYGVLGAFSMLALLPIVGILFTALQDRSALAPFGSFQGIHLRSITFDADIRCNGRLAMSRSCIIGDGCSKRIKL